MYRKKQLLLEETMIKISHHARKKKVNFVKNIIQYSRFINVINPQETALFKILKETLKRKKYISEYKIIDQLFYSNKELEYIRSFDFINLME